ncbi:HEAT repeat domain-containing protein [Tengunoibacter tsumagoiensis]|uniref:HEAT repeat domain-containing protein n=1 Tax=Tengunoibacter tsumagoiensis TaxID=2014871 RepID=A0A402AAG2_9CHLR|nr:HEAT repeat domain-containing protein [Tengunoibacter tsumagoiensis]GCE16026.1 hypothetical protein KTT_58850 [Tengunoibacter tsumagoiensis]
MHNKENEQHKNVPGENHEGAIEVPSTLLPNVLHHLGLTSEQQTASQNSSVESLLATLQDSSWEKRAAAVRALGTCNVAIPMNAFLSVLHDEDATVRATAVHTIGTMERRAPLHWLVEALHDSDWHVREVAVLALGKQKERIPNELIMIALHDADEMVRQTARSVLHDQTKRIHEQNWEKISMQKEQYDTSLRKNRQTVKEKEKEAQPEYNGAIFEYSSHFAASRSVKEQAQVYTTHEYTPVQHRQSQPETESYLYSAFPLRGEKITSHRLRRKSHKGWWAALIVTAIFCLELGRLSTLVVPSFQSGIFASPTSMHVSAMPTPGPPVVTGPPVVLITNPFPFAPDAYASIMQSELSKDLDLTPTQIQVNVRATRGDIDAVAAKQNLPDSQLHDIELNMLQATLTAAVNNKDINQQDADQLMQNFHDDSILRDMATLTLLYPESSIHSMVPPSSR